MSLESRAKRINATPPHLIADVVLYPASEGGRNTLALPGWGCPCMGSQVQPFVGYDAWPILGDTPLAPGDRRRLGFVFGSDENADVVRRAGKFFLWESGFIGEASVIFDNTTAQQD